MADQNIKLHNNQNTLENDSSLYHFWYIYAKIILHILMS